MFCARCGQQIPDASELCPLCGQPASINLPPPKPVQHEAMAPVVTPVSVLADQRPIDPKLKGVGGWLLFFCVAITILTPLGWVGRLTANKSFDLDAAIYLAVVVLGMITGLFCWIESPHAIPLLRAYFIVLCAVAVLSLIGAFAAMQDAGADAEPGSAVDGSSMVAFFGSLRMLIFALLWSTYFHKSERVRATFGRNLWGSVPR
jgi:hypothetical protein